MTQIAIIVGTKGRGSNMRAIIEACENGRINAEVACIISPSESAPAVETARTLGAKVVVPAIFDAELSEALSAHEVDLVCLAGYMRLIPIEVVETYEGRMLNIHPALLPRFGGKGMWGRKVHEAVLAAGETQSGCTVHFVTERYDEGTALFQLTCPVEPDDTPETLAARVLEMEHACYVQAIILWLERNV
ncbi:MAG: phosphoribosylglycinamide formyltransferase [Armatimonadota bacterium]|nr:phosphoribosylglycinamide formyltransferase [Armatimonadota bacterium]